MGTITGSQNIIKGQAAEQAAADYLISLGYRILARNYRVHGLGELDPIAALEGVLTVVEVKARHRADLYGGPEASIRQNSGGSERRLRFFCERID